MTAHEEARETMLHVATIKAMVAASRGLPPNLCCREAAPEPCPCGERLGALINEPEQLEGSAHD